jgi:uncharacterized lipoprotein YbaY
MSRLRLRLRVGDPDPDDRGSTVRVEIRDTTLADALHPTIAEATGTMAPDGERAELSVDLPDEPLDPRHRYSVWAHVDHTGNGQLQAGDLITAESIPIDPVDVDADDPVDVPMRRI